MKNIKEIRFPNTVEDEKQASYRVVDGDKVKVGVDRIIEVYKNGEMASVSWFQIIKSGKIIAEIKESVCDVFGDDDYQEPISDVPF